LESRNINTMITVSGIYIYPVKGMRGLSLNEAFVEKRGFRDDRRWLVTDLSGHFHSQRDLPELATFDATPIEGGLQLGHKDSELEIPIPGDDPREVTVWRSTVIANDAGDEVAAWLSLRLGSPVRLVHMPESTRREVNPEFNTGDDIVSFADGYPLLLANEASLDDLNRRLPVPILMNRFRPNVVISGAEAWAEDYWPKLTINGVPFRNPKPCARCQVTTQDQLTGESMGQEPLRTLATFRLIDGKAMFAANLIPDAEGTIRIGDLLSEES